MLFRPLSTLVAFTMVAAMFVTMASITPASAAVFFACTRGTNLSFEDPVIPDTWRSIHESDVPGWETQAADGMIEFWVDGFLGVFATDGQQITELQANTTAPMYQDIPTTQGDVISWSVDHKGRVGTDSADVQIGAPASETTVQSMVTSPAAWVTYSGSYTVPGGQTTTRFMLNPIGSGSVGNLVDNVALALTCGLDATTTDVSVADTDTSGTDTAGDIVTVTISVTNTGSATLLDLDATDVDADTATCAVATLMPGETTTCTTTYTLGQADLDSGEFSGSAMVGGRDAANVSVSDSATYSYSLLAAPSFDISLDTTVDMSVAGPVTRVDPGDTVTYTGAVTNTGNVTISNVEVITDVGGPLTCVATDLAPGESTTCSATYSVTQVDIDIGSLDAIGSFSATPAQGGDLSATDTADVLLAHESELTVGLDASALTYDTVGMTIDLTVTVTNTGNTTVRDIDVAHDMSFGTPLDCGTTPFDLLPGETRSCAATRTISQDDLDAGEITGTATATGADPTDTTVVGASDLLTLSADQQPSITLGTSSTLDMSVVSPADRADPGDRATVTYTITNTGNVTLSGVSLSGPLGTPISCPATFLAPSGYQECVVDVDLTQGDIDTGAIDAVATVDATAPDISTVSDAEEHMIVIDRDPRIDINTTVDGVTSHGDGTYTVLYTVTVSNTGNTSLTGMDVQDGLAVTFPDATVTLTAPATDPFLPSTVLLPGTSVAATFTVVVNAVGVAGPYDTSSAATASSPVGDVSATAVADVTFDVSYDLTVSVDAPASAAPGGSYTQKLTVSNAGPAAAFGPVILTLTLDPSASYQTFSGEGWTCSAVGDLVTCTHVEKIDAGSSTDVSIVTLIDADLGATLHFDASVAASNSGDDADPSNNVLAVQLSVDQLPVTGISSDQLALIGLLLVLAGGALVVGTRKSYGAVVPSRL
ncbi:MAG: LPXTG cell wall anchor domain-containing protein [Acidimicrobiia bacterium]